MTQTWYSMLTHGYVRVFLRNIPIGLSYATSMVIIYTISSTSTRQLECTLSALLKSSDKHVSWEIIQYYCLWTLRFFIIPTPLHSHTFFGHQCTHDWHWTFVQVFAIARPARPHHRHLAKFPRTLTLNDLVVSIFEARIRVSVRFCQCVLSFHIIRWIIWAIEITKFQLIRIVGVRSLFARRGIWDKTRNVMSQHADVFLFFHSMISVRHWSWISNYAITHNNYSHTTAVIIVSQQ